MQPTPEPDGVRKPKTDFPLIPFVLAVISISIVVVLTALLVGRALEDVRLPTGWDRRRYYEYEMMYHWARLVGVPVIAVICAGWLTWLSSRISKTVNLVLAGSILLFTIAGLWQPVGNVLGHTPTIFYSAWQCPFSEDRLHEIRDVDWLESEGCVRVQPPTIHAEGDPKIVVKQNETEVQLSFSGDYIVTLMIESPRGIQTYVEFERYHPNGLFGTDMATIHEIVDTDSKRSEEIDIHHRDVYIDLVLFDNP